VETAFLLGRAREWLDSAEAALGGDLIAVVAERGAPELTVEQLARLDEALIELVDVVQQLGSHSLPVDAITLELDAVRRGIVADFEDGMLDPHRVLLGAGLFDARSGSSAFAEALRTGAHGFWEDLTLGEVLARFQGSDPLLAPELAAQAGVSTGVLLAKAQPDELERIANVLERFGKG
jgi:hypothetical protein